MFNNPMAGRWFVPECSAPEENWADLKWDMELLLLGSC